MIQLEIPQVVSFFTDKTVSPDTLWPLERAVAVDFSSHRKAGFAAGRYCARNAMDSLGVRATDIPMGEGRAPVWPADLSGSISHRGGLAGALVSKKEFHPSIGLDIEERAAVERELWDILFTDAEQLRLERAEHPREQATLLFSLKESYYKMQYPMTRSFLDFRDVELEETPEGLLIRRLKELSEPEPLHVTGHRWTDGFIITWVLALPG